MKSVQSKLEHRRAEKKKGVDTTEYERNIAKQKKGEKTEEQKSSVLDEIKID